MTLDRYDRNILNLLQENGRLSNQELADAIGLSPSPCLRRVRALEESGLILGYRALLLNRITRIEGVTGVRSSFVLRRVLDKTAPPLPD